MPRTQRLSSPLLAAISILISGLTLAVGSPAHAEAITAGLIDFEVIMFGACARRARGAAAITLAPNVVRTKVRRSIFMFVFLRVGKMPCAVVDVDQRDKFG